jgi:Zn-dependent peptidase ImmA (M78 family)
MNNKNLVWEAVESFRRRHLPGERQLPIDVFTLVELVLKLDVIPFDDLFAKYERDAAITVDFTGIYVDAEAYLLWEMGPVWKQKRLRFSVAHEIGHLVLHRNLAENQKFNSFDEFALWTKSNNGENYGVEQAANEFAGRLLVPVERLKEYFDNFATQCDQQMFQNWRSNQGMREMFAENAAPHFGVNSQVISVRLDRENIWPAD